MEEQGNGEAINEDEASVRRAEKNSYNNRPLLLMKNESLVEIEQVSATLAPLYGKDITEAFF